MDTNVIYQGHVLDTLKVIPNDSVDLVITSPPYWGLRDYGANCKAVWGGDKDCQHEWELTDGIRRSWGSKSRLENQKQGTNRGALSNVDAPTMKSDFCSKCGAWHGQLGLEPDFHLYVEHLIKICDGLKRVLKKAGSFYLNIGDTYGGGSGGYEDKYINTSESCIVKGQGRMKEAVYKRSSGPAPKCLLGIPERVMLALIDQGWILRNKIIWYKPSHMPSSVQDRLTNSYEYLYHFVKSRKYYYDLDAIRIPHTVCGVTDLRPMGVLRQKLYPNTKYNKSSDPHLSQFIGTPVVDDYEGKFVGFGEDAEKYGSPRVRTQGYNSKYEALPNEVASQNKLIQKVAYERKVLGVPRDLAGSHPLGKNPSDVWAINTYPFKGMHFATFPLDVCYRPILSSCPKDGVVLDIFGGSGTVGEAVELLNRFAKSPSYEEVRNTRKVRTVPLDMVANRKWIMIEINSSYVDMMRKRLSPYGTFLAKAISNEQ